MRLPVHHGICDLDYVNQAMARIGVHTDIRHIANEVIDSGRTGAAVHRILARDNTPFPSLILKILPAVTWRDKAMDGRPGGEAVLWLSGVTAQLPEPLECPMLDVSRDREGNWWMLMEDISAGFCPRGGFGLEHERIFLPALAGLHAQYWQHQGLPDMGLASLEGTARVWAEPMLAQAGGAPAIQSAPAWVRGFLEDFTPMAVLLPVFLELLGPDNGDFYLEFARTRAWSTGLSQQPYTVIHGDLRRANISFQEGGKIGLIDWEFAAAGPAVCDLAWHFLLHCWAYPASSEDPMEVENTLVDHYLVALTDKLGVAVDRAEFDRAREAAWLRALAQLGYCIADPAVGTSSPAQREPVRSRAVQAITRARRFLGA